MTLSYLLRRFGSAILILWLVSLLVFFITQILPGNAAVMVLGEFATPETLAAMERRLHLHDPWWVQYSRWIGGILAFDWGVSMGDHIPVLPAVMLAFGRSLSLAAMALVVVVFIAIPLGTMAAVRRGRFGDLALSVLGYIGVSVPEFVIATLLVITLARPELGWFPGGGYESIAAGVWPWLSHYLLPVATLTIVLIAHIARQVRSEMIDVLATDYIRTAVLKGLPYWRVLLKHALPNAMLPTITIIALDVGYLIGGIIVVEEVFAFPGLGRLLIFAVQNRDLPMIQAGALVLATLYALTSLAADLLYAWIDRRIIYA
ncbi:MAG: ABC transporter permease [Ramlibacter sp.]|nr:ABC transporter permease [Ramlibacter sp.]